VFELARRIGFGMDVGDLLELERAFHRDGVVHAATQEQRVVLVGKLFGELGDDGFQIQHFLHRAGQMAQVLQMRHFLLMAQATALFGQHQGQQEQGGELSGECLGRSHTDLRAGAGE